MPIYNYCLSIPEGDLHEDRYLYFNHWYLWAPTTVLDTGQMLNKSVLNEGHTFYSYSKIYFICILLFSQHQLGTWSQALHRGWTDMSGWSSLSLSKRLQSSGGDTRGVQGRGSGEKKLGLYANACRGRGWKAQLIRKPKSWSLAGIGLLTGMWQEGRSHMPQIREHLPNGVCTALGDSWGWLRDLKLHD